MSAASWAKSRTHKPRIRTVEDLIHRLLEKEGRREVAQSELFESQRGRQPVSDGRYRGRHGQPSHSVPQLAGCRAVVQ